MCIEHLFLFLVAEVFAFQELCLIINPMLQDTDLSRGPAWKETMNI